MLYCCPCRAVHAAAGCTLLALGVAPAHAQRSGATPHTAANRWTIAAEYLQVGAGPIHRRAEPSMSVTVGHAFGAGDPTRAAQVTLGWLRASRVTTQAQGVTAGLSVGLPLGAGTAWSVAPGPTLVVRPGFAVLAGWAEAQTQEPLYDWRGLPATSFAGQTGSEMKWQPVRGRTTGAGLSLAADLRLTRTLSLASSVQRWSFTGPVIRPNRLATLAGVGLAVHPRAFANTMTTTTTAGSAR